MGDSFFLSGVYINDMMIMMETSQNGKPSLVRSFVCISNTYQSPRHDLVSLEEVILGKFGKSDTQDDLVIHVK